MAIFEVSAKADKRNYVMPVRAESQEDAENQAKKYYSETALLVDKDSIKATPVKE